MKSWLTKKDRLLAGTIIAGASVLGFAGPATAQEQADAAEEEIIVTGSRIPQPQLTSISPVQQIGAEEIASRGVTRVEDMINQLPQAVTAQASGVSNGASGTAQADLRSLGSQRTLVLIDGRRLVPGDPGDNTNSAAPDLNAIPAALVERVEVLTGGASAVYGADAVAGVINFIMADDFEGARFDAQYSFYQHNNEDDQIGDLADREALNSRFFRVPDDNVVDGETFDFTAIFGANSEDGRGNVTAYAGYRNIKPIIQSERGFSACAFSTNTTPALFCGGSSTTFPTRIQAVDQTPGVLAELPGTAVQVGPGGTIPAFATAGQFNFAPYNYYQRPDERYTLGAFAHYEVNPHVDLYTQIMFMDDRSIAQIAPSGLFRGSGLGSLNGNYAVNCDNPFLSPALVTHICTNVGLGPTDIAIVSLGHRNVNGQPRQDDLRHTMYRAVLGARGDLVEGWSYDVYAQYGTTIYQDNYLNEVSLSRTNNALINIGGECGINVDADPTNDDTGCVPLNVFSVEGPTPEQLAYVVTPGFKMGSVTQQIFEATLTGDLGVHGVRSPWAEDGVALALGTQYRREESELRPDTKFCPSTELGTVNDLLGQGSTTCPVAGSYDAIELFGEARIPLVQNQPLFHQLGVELAYRYSDYSLGFKTDTYKAGGDWAPVEDLRFRSSIQRAVRAPNIVELFAPAFVGLFGTTDPCAGILGDAETDNDPSASLADCQFSGVTPAQYGNIEPNPASQYNGLGGGTATLQPEVADTVTLGFVFTPSFISGLTLAVDWYNIQIADRIGGRGTDLTLIDCLNNHTPESCDRVHRTPGTGSLWLGPNGFIDNINENTGEIETTGIDIEGNYRVDFADWGMEGAGGLSVNFVGTRLEEYIIKPALGAEFDCAGRYGPVCTGAMGGFGNPLPDWRHKLRVAWETPLSGLELAASWRHVSEVVLDEQSVAIFQGNDPTAPLPVTEMVLGSRDYFDLAGTWDILDNVTFRAGVNNVFDEDPPLTGQSNCPSGPCSGNTWPGVYDATGRYIFFGISADF